MPLTETDVCLQVIGQRTVALSELNFFYFIAIV